MIISDLWRSLVEFSQGKHIPETIPDMSTLAGRCLETISQSREKETNLERTTAVSVEGTEERSRRRMEEGGGERERVTDTSSSRVVLSVECAAHMVKLRPRRPAPFSFYAEIRSLAWSSFYIFYIKLICIFRDCTHEE